MTDVALIQNLMLATLLFSVGLAGVLFSRNAIKLLISSELMLTSVNINFVAFNNYLNLDVLAGQVFSVFILTISAAEAAIGLAIVVALFRLYRTVDVEKFRLLKW
ncbi:MAG: NADH-quinone oxidoreductase subunit NuoK [Candidatus Melainabacteria bacterium]|nr:NADH-quinone oxidoreductase subunit NuoK [Candidatus Melainabacteria bacterium]